MTEKTTKYKHLICLIGIFILGEAVIAAPYSGADSLNVLALFCACTVAAVGIFFLTPLLSRFFSEENTKNNPVFRVCSTLCYSIAIIFSVFLAAKSFVSLNNFVSEVVLIKTSGWITALVLAVLAAVTALSGKDSIFKFSLIATVICVIIIAALFVFSMPNFEVRNIVPYTYLPSDNLIGQTVEYLLKVFAPCLIAVIYVCLTHRSPRGALICDGVLLGGIMLLFCIANSILIFGASTAADMQFPYSNAVSTVTLGELFTRMDGFSYLLIFVATVTRITVCLKSALILITRLGLKYKRSFIIACAALMFVLAVI